MGYHFFFFLQNGICTLSNFCHISNPGQKLAKNDMHCQDSTFGSRSPNELKIYFQSSGKSLGYISHLYPILGYTFEGVSHFGDTLWGCIPWNMYFMMIFSFEMGYSFSPVSQNGICPLPCLAKKWGVKKMEGKKIGNGKKLAEDATQAKPGIGEVQNWLEKKWLRVYRQYFSHQLFYPPFFFQTRYQTFAVCI